MSAVDSAFFRVNWAELFSPDVPLLETVLRGSVVFVGIFLLLSLARNREAGPLSVNNVLVLVLLAASAHSALSGGSDSITNALVLVVTIAGWSYAVDWLGYRFGPVRRMLRPEPLPLITDGQPDSPQHGERVRHGRRTPRPTSPAGVSTTSRL